MQSNPTFELTFFSLVMLQKCRELRSSLNQSFSGCWSTKVTIHAKCISLSNILDLKSTIYYIRGAQNSAQKRPVAYKELQTF